jgi:hypothetical protein
MVLVASGGISGSPSIYVIDWAGNIVVRFDGFKPIAWGMMTEKSLWAVKGRCDPCANTSRQE